jgi:hypothetical protein
MPTVESWLAGALADAERRGLPDLRPLLDTLARSAEALRRLDDELRQSGAEPPGTDR